MAPSAFDWFIRADERGNPATDIDGGRAGRAWTAGNTATVLIDGVEYFQCLHDQFATARAGDTVLIAGLELDADQLLTPDGVTLGGLLVELLGRGVTVKVLAWRSHPNYTATRNLEFARMVNAAGGDVRLDNRIRRLGSLHQKIVVLLRADRAEPDVAFVGGIDLSHGGRDDARHRGDVQRADLAAANYGPRPPWHDVQLMLQGPAVQDLTFTFAERWNDPTPLDRRNPWRWLVHLLARQHATRTDLIVPRPARPEPEVGPYAVQVLRTYPARRRPYPFAPEGERSIARAYLHALTRARRLVYLEDQYVWSYRATAALADALRRAPELRVVIVTPRFPDPDGWLSGPASGYGRRNVMRTLTAAGGGRVAAYDVVNDADVPIYVHSKVCIVDDEWISIGSDNFNRRSWSHDSEVACTVVAPGGPENLVATDTRLRLAAEHLELEDAASLTDPVAWFEAFRAVASRAEAWQAAGRPGARPRGRVRTLAPDDLRRIPRAALTLAHDLVLDPDGRPAALRRSGRY